MKIKTGKINTGERFCCSKSAVKQVFAGMDINVNFAYFSRHHKYDKVLKQKKHTGKIIAELNIRKTIRDEKSFLIENFRNLYQPSLYFYILRNEEFTDELEQEFIREILPKMKYMLDSKDINDTLNVSDHCYYQVAVELLNEKLYLHEEVVKWK